MYKLVLCWRYLRTRYIALASIISVTLGVATMIVVNSVMEGFTHEMQHRIHGILSDLSFQSYGLEGFPDAGWHMDEIRRVAGDAIAGMTPTVHVPAMLSFKLRERWQMRQVNLIGIDSGTHASVSDFAKYLQHPENRQQLSLELHEGGYDVRDHQAGPEAQLREQMEDAGWPYRRAKAEWDGWLESQSKRGADAVRTGDRGPVGQDPSPTAALEGEKDPSSSVLDPFKNDPQTDAGENFDPSVETHPGAVIGIALASYRDREGKDRFVLLPGDDVQLTVATAGTPPQPANQSFTVVDFYESKMSEYDSSFVFVPLEELQTLRGMYENATGRRWVTSIQIKLREGVDLDRVRDKLRQHFSPDVYRIETWRDKQGPLLAAVTMETAILNVLLFLIIAVAGFGILAIFYMIVVEKTRDIGILKSLGASGQGIMGIFLAYGLSLGLVGSGAGLVLGLLFVVYINEIADLLGRVTGKPLFDPSIYYFHKIPTIVEPWTVSWIVAGALVIAVMASILPARRAARLHPVEALRYE